MAFEINQKKDFSIKRSRFTGDLKPHKVSQRSLADSAINTSLAGKSDQFGNRKA